MNNNYVETVHLVISVVLGGMAGFSFLPEDPTEQQKKGAAWATIVTAILAYVFIDVLIVSGAILAIAFLTLRFGAPAVRWAKDAMSGMRHEVDPRQSRKPSKGLPAPVTTELKRAIKQGVAPETLLELIEHYEDNDGSNHRTNR